MNCEGTNARIAALIAPFNKKDVAITDATTFARKGDEERIRDAGAEGYLAKPASIGPFMAAVKGLAEKVG